MKSHELVPIKLIVLCYILYFFEREVVYPGDVYDNKTTLSFTRLDAISHPNVAIDLNIFITCPKLMFCAV